MIVQLGGLQNLRGMEKTKINDCLFMIKFSSYWYHHKIVIISLWDKKNRFVTVLWSQSAIRVEKIKISRKRDLHKIIIISLWDHLHKDDFRIWGYEEKKFCDRTMTVIGYSWEVDRNFERRRFPQNKPYNTMRSFR